MNGQQCYCISKFGQDGPSNSCTVPCVSDATNYCGSHEAMSVYATGQQGMVCNNTPFYQVTKYKTIANARFNTHNDFVFVSNVFVFFL